VTAFKYDYVLEMQGLMLSKPVFYLRFVKELINAFDFDEEELEVIVAASGHTAELLKQNPYDLPKEAVSDSRFYYR
jgi:hypothetical protein